MAKSTKKPAADASTDPAAVAAAMMAVNPVPIKAWQDVMTECSRFITQRLHQDLEVQKAMLTCTSPAELIQLQTEFYQTAIKQYSEQTMRMMQMMSDAAETTLQDAKTGHKRKYNDVPL